MIQKIWYKRLMSFWYYKNKNRLFIKTNLITLGKDNIFKLVFTY